MNKNITKFLALGVLGLASCSSSDEPSGPGQDRPSDGRTATVTMTLSRAAQDDFREAGITSISIYTYKSTSEGYVLDSKTDISPSDGTFSLQYLLGENLQAFAVANAASVTDADRLETVKLHIDPRGENVVWLSGVVRFSSDKSVSSIDLQMERVVSQLNFTPVEDAAELQTLGRFDRIDYTFKGISDTYVVSGRHAEPSDVTVSSDASAGFKASVYTFETATSGTAASLFLDYYKGGAQVNSSYADLSLGVIKGSMRYNVTFPVTDANYLATSWTGASQAAPRAMGGAAEVRIECSEL